VTRHRAVALELRLRNCSNVLTLGVKPNFSDYSPRETELIRNAEKIYYPSQFYAELFDAMGKKTFPSYHNYKCAQDKIKQTALFQLLNLPHPRTRVYYGKRQKASIARDFQFPLVGKVPKGSAMGRGVYLITNELELKAYCQRVSPAYIQEYLPIDRDMRVVVVGQKIVHAYWRIAPLGEFRTNVALGARICLDPLPQEALDLALNTARACGWDDVGIDVCQSHGNFYVLEGNMKYGKEGFRRAGIDYDRLMESMIENGEI
jgi:ribosomal protein S6--L-glutamate ligase